MILVITIQFILLHLNFEIPSLIVTQLRLFTFFKCWFAINCYYLIPINFLSMLISSSAFNEGFMLIMKDLIQKTWPHPSPLPEVKYILTILRVGSLIDAYLAFLFMKLAMSLVWLTLLIEILLWQSTWVIHQLKNLVRTMWKAFRFYFFLLFISYEVNGLAIEFSVKIVSFELTIYHYSCQKSQSVCKSLHIIVKELYGRIENDDEYRLCSNRTIDAVIFFGRVGQAFKGE